jgi:hypothetical protein
MVHVYPVPTGSGRLAAGITLGTDLFDQRPFSTNGIEPTR